MSRQRVAIVRGGLSDEFKVSLLTGASMLDHIDRSRYEPIDVVMARSGEWLIDGRARLPEHILHAVDVVLNALHGTYGEDGKFQQLLERFGVPYTGSGPYASALAMHKVLTKQHLRHSHIKLAPHVHVTRESLPDIGRIAANIIDTFGQQYVIKPVSSGSSVGTIIVKNPLFIDQELRRSLAQFDEVMIEPRIDGREATCGVIERFRGKDVYALPVIEIVPPSHADFFDETVKYDGTTEEICPGRFDAETKRRIEEAATFIHTTLGLSQYSRSDFIVGKDDIYFLEVNTLPGMTKESLLPKAIAAVGGAYPGFLSHLIDDAIAGKMNR